MKHLKKLLSAFLVMTLLLSGLPVYAAETAEAPDAAADYAIIQETHFVFQWQKPIKRTHKLTAEYDPASGLDNGITVPKPSTLSQEETAWKWQCVEYPDVQVEYHMILRHEKIVRLFGPDVDGKTIHFLAVPNIEVPAVNIRVSGASMTLGNDLSMNFFIKKTDVPDDQAYYAVITKHYADGRPDVTLRIPRSDWKNHEDVYYRLRFDNISAKEMTDQLEVRIYRPDDTPAGDVWIDSTRDYVVRILDEQQPAAQKMLVDMLNYGAEAQKFFQYHTDDLANNKLTDVQKGFGSTSVAMENRLQAGPNYYGSRLVLKSNISLVMYFHNITPEMRAEIQFTNHRGKPVTVNVDGAQFLKDSGGCGVACNELVVADARQPVTCKVYDAGNNLVASAADSVESYAARMSSSNALYEMIMRFASSSYDYFHPAK